LAGLAQSVEADAKDVVRGYRTRSEWTGPFARYAPWLVVAAAAGLVGLWFVPTPPSSETPSGSVVEQSVGPSDQNGAVFVLSAQPPSGTTLIGLEER
jgi:hypothetical protein